VITFVNSRLPSGRFSVLVIQLRSKPMRSTLASSAYSGRSIEHMPIGMGNLRGKGSRLLR
jgi:hypothetical protein